MANYDDEMEELLKSVREYVDKLSSLTEIQEQLKGYDSELENLIRRCDLISERMKDYTSVTAGLEEKYRGISDNLDEAIRNYKNVSAAYNLVETEYKTINVKFDEFLENLNKLSERISVLEAHVNNTLETRNSELVEIISKRNRRTTTLLVITLIFAVAAVVLGIVIAA